MDIIVVAQSENFRICSSFFRRFDSEKGIIKDGYSEIDFDNFQDAEWKKQNINTKIQEVESVCSELQTEFDRLKTGDARKDKKIKNYVEVDFYLRTRKLKGQTIS